MIELTISHWVYLLGIIAVLITMALRRETPLICIVAAFILALVTTGDIVCAVQALYNAIQVAFSELLGIVLIISIIVAMAKILEETGIADKMFSPFRAMLKGPGTAFWVMGLVIMVASWLLWPSPAIALIGALLLPAALRAGLPPIGAAMAISMFGYGIALTTDFVIQGAPSISAKAAGVDVTQVMSQSIPLVIIWAAIALPLSYLSIRKDIIANGGRPIKSDLFDENYNQTEESIKWSKAAPGFKKFITWVIVLLFVTDIITMIVFKLRGGDATALLGGTILLIMVMVSLGVYGKEGLEKITEHSRTGFKFGIKIFAPVFFIAAFFFMGASGPAKVIFGANATGLLFDLGQAFANVIPMGKVTAAISQSIVGAVTGLDGSGFSGLPLIGSMARVLGTPSDLNLAALTALGQFFCIAVGGGCIVPWAVIPAAGITGTDPVEVARRNLFPTVAGLLGVVIVSLFFL